MASADNAAPVPKGEDKADTGTEQSLWQQVPNWLKGGVVAGLAMAGSVLMSWTGMEGRLREVEAEQRHRGRQVDRIEDKVDAIRDLLRERKANQ